MLNFGWIYPIYLYILLYIRLKNILAKRNIKPFRVWYYCERRDSDFHSKMHNVLLVYKQVYHWAWNLDDINATEIVVTETFSKSVDN